MSLEHTLKEINEDRRKVELAINKLIDDFEAKHKGAFVKDVENGGYTGKNEFTLRIEISI